MLSDKIQFIAGSVHDLFKQVDFRFRPPCFIVVDADHSYAGAKTDLCAILSRVPNVPALAFHDYDDLTDGKMLSEHPEADQVVCGISRAIRDVIGDDGALHPVGIIHGESEKRSPAFGYSYGKKGGREGVILFPELLDRTAFIMAQTFCAAGWSAPADDQLKHAFTHSRWIKLGRKLGFMKSATIPNE